MNASTTSLLFTGLLLMGLAGDIGIENPDTLVVADAIGTQRGADSNETIEQY